MKNILIIMLIGLLLVSPVIAKSIQAVDKLDWTAKKLRVNDVGVYDGELLVKTKDKAEIWIDKKVGDTYHVDSLRQTDTLITIELYYEVQPDTIDYRSHNGKYEEVYTYNDWAWKECSTNNCTGGNVLLDTIIEYGLGSNTYTSAISGATWQDDGIDVTLTDGTDYNVDGSQFDLLTANYWFSNISTNWGYQYDSNTKSSTFLHLTVIFIGISLIALAWLFIKYQIRKV